MSSHSYDVFSYNIERAHALLELTRDLHDKRGQPRVEVVDVMRSAIVFAVSAFDAYLHAVVVDNIAKAALDPNSALLEWVKSWKLGAAEYLAAIVANDSVKALVEAAGDQLASRTLQDPSKVQLALEYIGLPTCWKLMSNYLDTPEHKLRSEFNEVIQRRHKIAHEADLDPSSKTGYGKRRLPRELAVEYVNRMQRVGTAVAHLVATKYA